MVTEDLGYSGAVFLFWATPPAPGGPWGPFGYVLGPHFHRKTAGCLPESWVVAEFLKLRVVNMLFSPFQVSSPFLTLLACVSSLVPSGSCLLVLFSL